MHDIAGSSMAQSVDIPPVSTSGDLPLSSFFVWSCMNVLCALELYDVHML